MQQLTCVAPGTVEWVDVPEPDDPGPGGALIRPVAVSRCEIDPLLIGAGPARPPGPDAAPFALGHEAVGEVLAVDSGVTSASVGQLVVPAFQVSCGICEPCSRGRTAVCAEYPVLSDYGMQPLSGVEYGGMISEVVRVPHADAMLHPVPAGLTPMDVVGVADNVSDGYRAVAPHLPDMPGADVLVAAHGNHSIGLFAAQAAVALGAGSVTFAADDDAALALAESVGATPLRTDFARRARRFPLVVDCGARADGLRYAIDSTEPEGTCHSVSGYLEGRVEVPMLKMYTLGIRFLVGRLHASAVIPEVLDLVAAGALRPRDITTRVVPWDESPAAYQERTTKLVVTRDEA